MNPLTRYLWIILRVLLLAGLLCSCTNPFAPKLEESLPSDNVLGDQRTIDGVFQNFRYAYTFKDTLIYGALLAPEFTFVYRNYERGVDLSWGRSEDMISTTGLFQSARNLDLTWNEVIVSFGDSLSSTVSRGFNLAITFSANDVIHLDGRVNLQLQRNSTKEPWLIYRWRDESNF